MLHYHGRAGVRSPSILAPTDLTCDHQSIAPGRSCRATRETHSAARNKRHDVVGKFACCLSWSGRGSPVHFSPGRAVASSGVPETRECLLKEHLSVMVCCSTPQPLPVTYTVPKNCIRSLLEQRNLSVRPSPAAEQYPHGFFND
jgi:hypothetical protein